MKRPRGHKVRRILSNAHKARNKKRLTQEKSLKPQRDSKEKS